MSRKRVGIVYVLVALMVLAFSQGASAESFKIKPAHKALTGVEYVPNEIIVQFQQGVSEGEIASINADLGTEVKRSSVIPGKFKVLDVKNKSAEEVIAQYLKHDKVLYAEQNSYCSAFSVPNDPYYSPYQWNFDNPVYGGIHMESAWNITAGDPSVIVGILDSGVAYETYSVYQKAPDLAGTTFVAGYDFINNDAHPNDDEGHGTHVCGTIAQTTNNSLGVAGIAYNCAIMPVKVLDSEGNGTADALANGLYYAADHGADVINMSLGWAPGYNPGATVENAIAYAYNHGVTLCAASGNDSQTTVSYPAAYDNYCIAVGATRYDEAVAYYSNTGAALDITAPGGDVTIDQNGDGYVDGILQQTFAAGAPTSFNYYFYQGTSMATPHVTAVAALVIAHGATGPNNVRAALQNTADDKGVAGWDSQYGHGLLNAYAALNYTAPVNHAPVAVVGGPYTGTTGVAVAFNGSASYDPDNNPITYSWSFGDGATGSGANPTHVYAVAGTYTVTLIVNDGQLNSTPSSTTATITASSTPVTVVSNITLTKTTSGKNIRGNASVKVVNGSGVAVASATIYAHWSGVVSENEVFTTNSSGIGTCSSAYVKKATGNFVFTIDNVVKTGYTFDAAHSILTASLPTGAQGADGGSLVAYPNPANPSTRISFSIENPTDVSLTIFNVLGQQVRTLSEGFRTNGTYHVTWDGRDDSGISMTTGIYFARLNIGGEIENLRILLAK